MSEADVRYSGSATDAQKRVGEAFAVSRMKEGIDEEIRVVVDPTAGMILVVEKIWHGPLVLGSYDHVGSSTTYLEYRGIDSLAPCEEIEGCEVLPPEG